MSELATISSNFSDFGAIDSTFDLESKSDNPTAPDASATEASTYGRTTHILKVYGGVYEVYAPSTAPVADIHSFIGMFTFGPSSPANASLSTSQIEADISGRIADATIAGRFSVMDWFESDPAALANEWASASQREDAVSISDRIAYLLLNTYEEYGRENVSAALSIKDFLGFMSSQGQSFRKPTISMTPDGLIHAQWSQDSEVIILQFTGNENVDYYSVMKHPTDNEQVERFSSRCSTISVMEHLSQEQKDLLQNE